METFVTLAEEQDIEIRHPYARRFCVSFPIAVISLANVSLVMWCPSNESTESVTPRSQQTCALKILITEFDNSKTCEIHYSLWHSLCVRKHDTRQRLNCWAIKM